MDKWKKMFKHWGWERTIDILQMTFSIKKVLISIKISLKLVPVGQFNKKPALVQMMAWCQTGNKPLFKPMLTQFIVACIYDSAWVS